MIQTLLSVQQPSRENTSGERMGGPQLATENITYKDPNSFYLFLHLIVITYINSTMVYKYNGTMVHYTFIIIIIIKHFFQKIVL